jgi:hypothetical protein
MVLVIHTSSMQYPKVMKHAERQQVKKARVEQPGYRVPQVECTQVAAHASFA